MASALVTLDRLAFRQALPNGGRLMGMDVGSKTIGLALCDGGWSFASPAQTLPRGKFTRDKALIAEIIGQQGVQGIVVGLPLNMDGTESPRSQASRAFARNIAELGLPILLCDERLSTAAVERQMIAEDLSRAKRAERVDKLAAAYILQSAIDGLTSPY